MDLKLKMLEQFEIKDRYLQFSRKETPNGFKIKNARTI
jgi:hypothetical protein